jgi:hypothetical protein
MGVEYGGIFPKESVTDLVSRNIIKRFVTKT